MYDIYAKLRDERGLTDYSVAKETGILAQTLYDWKSGRSTPKVDKLLLIARLFNVSVDELLGVADAVPKA